MKSDPNIIDNKSRLHVNIVEICGFISALDSLRLPYKLPCRSRSDFEIETDNNCFINTHSNIYIDIKDLRLMSNLVKLGNEHSKFVRSIQVWMEISAPLWFWSEMSTYTVGVTKLPSESTMHVDFKGLYGEDLMLSKDKQDRGYIQKRYYMFSYQSLRNIYFQRNNHRLPLWREFCGVIENLPFSEYLITIK